MTFFYFGSFSRRARDRVTVTNTRGPVKRAMEHHHSGGTRTTAAETFVKNVATACLFEIVEKEANVSKATISRLIGISTHQIGLAYCRVIDLLADGSVATPLQRKRRKDYIRGHLKPFTFNFLCNDKYTHLDTNQRLVTVIDPIMRANAQGTNS